VPRGRLLAPGLELKGAGNLVVAPPSLHKSGKRYVWDVPPPFMANGGYPVPPQAPAAWMLEAPQRTSRPIEAATVALGDHGYTAEGARRFDGVISVLEQGVETRHPRLVWAALRTRELIDAGHLSPEFAVVELYHSALAVWAGEDDPGEIDSVLVWAGLGGAP
jgi:Bifunctional DNA primase/polymerase, N-terminal